MGRRAKTCMWHRPRPVKGDVLLNKGGYALVRLPGHPRASKSGRVLEHIVVIEKALGRHLVKGETVHHKNGQRADNRIENLELWSNSQPSGQRVEDKLSWALDLVALYAPEKLK
jgi:hypothetical protein